MKEETKNKKNHWTGNKVDEATKKINVEESQSVANKYMNVFKKLFVSRIFGGIKKEDIENDTKLLS